MEPRINYTRVGLFVVVLTAVLVMALLWLSAGKRKEHLNYLVYMNEAASGLTEEAPVKFNGVEVGSITDISLNPKNPAQVRLLLSIEKETPISQATVAKLTLQGITGTTFIGLSVDKNKKPLPLVQLPGEDYPIIAFTPSLLVQLDAIVRAVGEDFHAISDAIGGVFTPENKLAISKTLGNLEQFTGALAKNSKEIEKGIKSASSTFSQGKIAAEAASQQAVPQIIESINKLNGLLNNMEQFTNSLKNNPSILIRGKAAPPLGPGER